MSGQSVWTTQTFFFFFNRPAGQVTNISNITDSIMALTFTLFFLLLTVRLAAKLPSASSAPSSSFLAFFEKRKKKWFAGLFLSISGLFLLLACSVCDDNVSAVPLPQCTHLETATATRRRRPRARRTRTLSTQRIWGQLGCATHLFSHRVTTQAIGRRRFCKQVVFNFLI